MAPTTVAVLGGGTSPERDISLETAREVVNHLPRDEFDPVFVEVLLDGTFTIGDRGPLDAGTLLLALQERGVQVVFPGLHGRYGEDGTVQGFLDVSGLPYVGSGVAASALAMDKARTREVLAAHGVTMPPAVEIPAMPLGEAADRVLSLFLLPVVVKDPTGGSSIDMAMVRSQEELEAALGDLLDRPGARVLVEELVPGTEITVPVLGNASVGGKLTALPAVLIRPLGSDWFDYATKYDPGAVDEICPAPLPEEVVARATEWSLLAHRVLRCDGLTRTDFIVPEDGIPRFLEINTLPGLTAASICPKAAAVAGISFSELLRRLVRMAFDRDQARAAEEAR